MTTRIALIGGPGSGKSTTAADLFVRLKKLGKNAELVPEWIRRDIMRNGVMTSVFEQYRTMMKHRQEEEHFPSSVEYIISDGNTILPYVYTAVYSNKTDPRERLVLTDMYESMLNDLYGRRYDHIYVIPRRIADEAGVSNFDDGTRFQTPRETEVLESLIHLLFTEIHRMDNMKVLDCPLHSRLEWILSDLLGEEADASWNAIRAKEQSWSTVSISPTLAAERLG